VLVAFVKIVDDQYIRKVNNFCASDGKKKLVEFVINCANPTRFLDCFDYMLRD